MNWPTWQRLRRLPRLLAPPQTEPAQHQERILKLQRDVVLPAKFVVIGVVFYYLYLSPWVTEAGNNYGVVFETIRDFFGAYTLLNLLVAVSFFVVRKYPAGVVQWVVFTVGFVDGVFLGALTLLTGGFESILYWVFPGLIVLNAVCIPLATPQIVLNLTLSAFYLGAGLLETSATDASQTVPFLPSRAARRAVPLITTNDLPDARLIATRLHRHSENDTWSRIIWPRLPESAQQRLATLLKDPNSDAELRVLIAEEINRLLPGSRYVFTQEDDVSESPAEPFLLRLAILWLFTFCCYGVQVLGARQQLAEEEQQEFMTRTDQLQSAGRLAAEFAHQIKNPLAIINNAAFSLRRSLTSGKGDPTQPIRIIQEEVEKADRIITQIMGYAQLSEGRVEKLHVTEELDRAIERVFPAGVTSGIALHRDYPGPFPPLLMQRGHLAEIFGNLLQNARDVLQETGHITVTGRCLPEYAIEVSVTDDGPGIPVDRLERIFEAYFTTRPKGTGLGLAIVKHNVELYGGSVRVESELGKGARFTVVFPAKTAVNLSRSS